MTTLSFREVLIQDFWIHFAGAIAVAIGLVDLWNFHSFSHDSDLLFIVGGFAGMGLKLVNGSAAALRTAALDTAYTAARTATTAAAAASTAAAVAGITVPPAEPPSP